MDLLLMRDNVFMIILTRYIPFVWKFVVITESNLQNGWWSGSRWIQTFLYLRLFVNVYFTIHHCLERDNEFGSYIILLFTKWRLSKSIWRRCGMIWSKTQVLKMFEINLIVDLFVFGLICLFFQEITLHFMILQ